MPKRDENGCKMLDYTAMKSASGNYIKGASMSDIGVILDMGIDAMRGDGMKYENSREGLENFKAKVREYLAYIVERNAELEEIEGSVKLIPDVEGACLYLGICRQTFYNYKGRSPEWEEAINLVTTILAATKKQLAFSFKMPPLLAVFDLCNNHGYINTSEFKLRTEPPEATVKPGMTKEEIKSLLSEVNSNQATSLDGLPD